MRNKSDGNSVIKILNLHDLISRKKVILMLEVMRDIDERSLEIAHDDYKPFWKGVIYSIKNILDEIQSVPGWWNDTSN